MRVVALRFILGNVAALSAIAVFAGPGDLLHTIPNPDPGGFEDAFGSAIVPYKGRILVGDRRSDRYGTDVGNVFLIDISSGDLLREFRNPTPRPEEEFGASIAVI